MAEVSHAVVSSDSENLILVDENDQEIGFDSKDNCHQGQGILHRAFSLFVFNPAGELLLQQRSGSKRLWPLYWSNSCCSHPRAGESMEQAVDRRLMQELGMRCQLDFLYKFQYQARFGDVGSENELCSVFLGHSGDSVRANGNEIAQWRFVSPAQLDQEIIDKPQQFTPWLKLEWQQINSNWGERLGTLIPQEA